MRTRTKEQLREAKKLFKKPPGPLIEIPLSITPHPGWMTRAYKNNRYVVMIADNVPMTGGIMATRVMVQRHDDSPIPNHWREMQAIKNEIFGPETMAIEYFPPESELIDYANIYWLWIFPDGVIPKPVQRMD